jgi:hypothetical protein
MLLADAAQAVNGKLYVLGGGWSVCGPAPTPMALAVKIEVPWGESNKQHRFLLELLDADGHPVSTPAKDGPVQVDGQFEVGRPAGLPPGTPIDFVFAVNISAVPLTPGAGFTWRLSIDGSSEDDWYVSFRTRPPAAAAQP